MRSSALLLAAVLAGCASPEAGRATTPQDQSPRYMVVVHGTGNTVTVTAPVSASSVPTSGATQEAKADGTFTPTVRP